jgi:hypothetical protein
VQIFQGQTFVYLCVGIKVQIFDGGGQVFCVCVAGGGSRGLQGDRSLCVGECRFSRGGRP